MKARTHTAVERERESYTLVNRSEAFLACIETPNKVYINIKINKLGIKHKINVFCF